MYTVNLHELIDRFGSQSPRTKTVAFLAFGAVIIAVLLFVFYLGVTKGDSSGPNQNTSSSVTKT